MLHATQFSIIEFLRSLALFTNVDWMYSGKALNADLPFATVEYINTGVATLDKQSTQQGNHYNFQVGVYANSANELTRFIDTLTKELAGKLPLYDTSGASPILTSDTIRSEVFNVVPMPVSATEDINGYHRCYFDVQVHVINQL